MFANMKEVRTRRWIPPGIAHFGPVWRASKSDPGILFRVSGFLCPDWNHIVCLQNLN